MRLDALFPEAPATVVILGKVASYVVVAAAGVGWLAWRRFRRHFVGLEESLEVLREDRAWIDALMGREQPR